MRLIGATGCQALQIKKIRRMMVTLAQRNRNELLWIDLNILEVSRVYSAAKRPKNGVLSALNRGK